MTTGISFTHSQIIFCPEYPVVQINLDFDWSNHRFVEWDQAEYNPPGHELLSWAHVRLRKDSGLLKIHVEDFESRSYSDAALSAEGTIDIFSPLGASTSTVETWVEVYNPTTEGRHRMRIWANENPEALYVAFHLT